MKGQLPATPRLAAACLAAGLCLSGCSVFHNPLPITPTAAVIPFEDTLITFHFANGWPVRDAPPPCGPAIDVSQVRLVDLGDTEDTTSALRALGEEAQFAHEQLVYTGVQGSVPQTVALLQRYVASQGCDILVVSERVTRSFEYWRARGASRPHDIPYLPVIWGRTTPRTIARRGPPAPERRGNFKEHPLNVAGPAPTMGG